MQKIIFILLVLILNSCARGTMRGAVAQKHNDKQAHITLGREEVSVGDTVNLFKNKCELMKDRVGEAYMCYKTLLGTGKVTSVLGINYCIVTLDGNAIFEDSTFIEKE
jgi:hypothetical protein